MKVKLYVRIAQSRHARKGWRADASLTPNQASLTDGGEALRTLRFAMEVDIAPELLAPAAWPVVEVELEEGEVTQIPLQVVPDVA
jgi:hypothetical protein